MSNFHVFLYHHRTGQAISAYEPAPMSLERIKRLADYVLAEDGDFFGLVDRDDCVLQFIYLKRSEHDDRPIRMEMPEANSWGSHIKHISNTELEQLLGDLPDALSTNLLSKLAPSQTFP
jgi:hypothetical protein